MRKWRRSVIVFAPIFYKYFKAQIVTHGAACRGRNPKVNLKENGVLCQMHAYGGLVVHTPLFSKSYAYELIKVSKKAQQFNKNYTCNDISSWGRLTCIFTYQKLKILHILCILTFQISCKSAVF